PTSAPISARSSAVGLQRSPSRTRSPSPPARTQLPDRAQPQASPPPSSSPLRQRSRQPPRAPGSCWTPGPPEISSGLSEVIHWPPTPSRHGGTKLQHYAAFLAHTRIGTDARQPHARPGRRANTELAGGTGRSPRREYRRAAQPAAGGHRGSRDAGTSPQPDQQGSRPGLNPRCRRPERTRKHPASLTPAAETVRK